MGHPQRNIFRGVNKQLQTDYQKKTVFAWRESVGATFVTGRMHGENTQNSLIVLTWEIIAEFPAYDKQSHDFGPR